MHVCVRVCVCVCLCVHGILYCKSECEDFEMALQHKSKLQAYKELKWEIGFEDYLKYVKEAPSRLFQKFCSGTHGLSDELGRHAKRGWGTGVS